MIDFILDKIIRAEITEEPFGHKFINNVFPDKYFEELINNLPEKKDFIHINKSGSVKSNYSAERYIFNLNFETIAKLDKSKKQTYDKLLASKI